MPSSSRASRPRITLPRAACSMPGPTRPTAHWPCWCCWTSSRAMPGAAAPTCSPPTARRAPLRALPIAAGLDQQVESTLRPFFYLPFMHSESLADQERSVELNAALDANTQRFAVLHRDIVARFGRFPHRNPMLGRETTPEEQAFLDQGGFAGSAGSHSALRSGSKSDAGARRRADAGTGLPGAGGAGSARDVDRRRVSGPRARTRAARPARTACRRASNDGLALPL